MHLAIVLLAALSATSNFSVSSDVSLTRGLRGSLFTHSDQVARPHRTVRFTLINRLAEPAEIRVGSERILTLESRAATNLALPEGTTITLNKQTGKYPAGTVLYVVTYVSDHMTVTLG